MCPTLGRRWGLLDAVTTRPVAHTAVCQTVRRDAKNKTMPASPRSSSHRSRSGPTAPVPVKLRHAPRYGRPQQPTSLLATLRLFVRRCADPTDTRAGCIVAAAILVGEALLTALIIRRVPCELIWAREDEELGRAQTKKRQPRLGPSFFSTYLNQFARTKHRHGDRLDDLHVPAGRHRQGEFQERSRGEDGGLTTRFVFSLMSSIQYGPTIPSTHFRASSITLASPARRARSSTRRATYGCTRASVL